MRARVLSNFFTSVRQSTTKYNHVLIDAAFPITVDGPAADPACLQQYETLRDPN
jgi:hypothetical protein